MKHWIVTLALAAAFVPATASAEAPFRAELPALVTSSGQALDAFTIKTFLGRAGVQHDYKPLAGVEDLKSLKTLVIAVGVSVKGFGAAGITTDTEMARTKALLEAAKKGGVRVIGVHIGGVQRREGPSEQFVQLVTPAADYLVVWEEGNADGYFTKVSAEKKIPLTLIKQPLEVGKALAQAFGK